MSGDLYTYQQLMGTALSAFAGGFIVRDAMVWWQRRRARRKAAAARATAPAYVPPPTPAAVNLDDPVELLSGYEDAVFASARHQIVPAGRSQADERAHLADAHRLHAHVRRLRVHVLDMMTQDGDPVFEADAEPS